MAAKPPQVDLEAGSKVSWGMAWPAQAQADVAPNWTKPAVYPKIAAHICRGTAGPAGVQAQVGRRMSRSTTQIRLKAAAEIARTPGTAAWTTWTAGTAARPPPPGPPWTAWTGTAVAPPGPPGPPPGLRR